MRPRRISDGKTFEPQVLKLVQRAFDEAWERIADTFPADEHEQARDHLAEAVINVARENSADAAMLRDAALRVMAAHDRRMFADGKAGQSGMGA
jgi:nucleotide-binding universal stress UspA family protein